MSRPIHVDVLPSHVYLSEEDQATLFGVGHPMTIFTESSQTGQVVYEEKVEVFGSVKRSLKLRVLGPNWKESHVEVTPTEAAFLGLKIKDEVKSGDMSIASGCTLVGPNGEVKIINGIIIPRPHLLCSPEEAASLHISNGDTISVKIVGEKQQELGDIVVRIHPTFRLRIQIHQDYARELWIVRPTHAII